MGLFNFMKSQYIETIEWTDTSTQTLVHLLPYANRYIKMGATLIVRESQVAVIVNEGMVADVFAPGKYTISHENLPLLSAQRSWKAGFKLPFRTNIYYVNTKKMTDLKWEAVNPAPKNTQSSGNTRLKANGTFSFRVQNAEKFMKGIFGSNQIYDSLYIIGQFRGKVIVRLVEMLNEMTLPTTDHSSHFDELSEDAENKLNPQFAAHGLELCSLTIENMIVPEATIAASIDVINTPKISSPKLENSMSNGYVIEVPNETAEVLHADVKCHECGQPIEKGMNFCSGCGAIAKQEYRCSCGYMLNPIMKFCPACGTKR